MSDSEKIKALVGDIERVLARYRSEFEMTRAAIVGSLEFIKAAIIAEAFEE